MQSFILFSATTNLARGRPTFASSVFDGATSGRAVDGLFYASGHAYENCYASEYEESPWWMLQLDRQYQIVFVLILACGEKVFVEDRILHMIVSSYCLSPSPEVIKLFSRSTQLIIKVSPLINMKTLTIVVILDIY